MTVRRILVATDGSERARRAVHWAADVANACEAELVLLRVIVTPSGPAAPAPAPRGFAVEQNELRAEAERLAGARGRARVVQGEKPGPAIVEAAEEEGADTLVVGNAGMSGRKEFLLGNVPNWISHNARCTVVIVNTEESARKGLGRLFRRER